MPQFFRYPISQRVLALCLLTLSVLLPLVLAVIGFLAVVVMPPHGTELHEILSRLFYFVPNLVHDNPNSVLLFLVGMWCFAIASTFYYFLIYWPTFVITQDYAASFVFGYPLVHLLWREVARVERKTIRVYNGLVWIPTKVISIQTNNRKLVLRETIVNFNELDEIVQRYSEQYRVQSERGFSQLG